MPVPTRLVAPASIVLAAALVAARGGAAGIAFYLCLAGLLACAAGALAALGRIVDGAASRTQGRLEVALAAVLAAVFFAGAAASSPAGLGLGGADLALLVGLAVCGPLALVALLPFGR